MSDVNTEFSQRATLAAKAAVESANNKLKSGVDSIVDAAKSAASAASLKIQSTFKTPDFPAKPLADAKNAASPESARANKPKFAGMLEYPAAMKYYATFEFFEYRRKHALETPKDIPVAVIALPMPANLVENFGVEYQTPALGPIVGAGVNSLAVNMQQGGGGIGAAQAALSSLRGVDFNTLKEVGVAGVFGLAKMAGPVGEKAAEVTSILAGVVPNPHLAIMFSNIGLRDHSFNYKFAPNSNQELQTLKKIVRQLKKSMLPRMSTKDMLYSYPHTCRITFHTGGNTPYTIKQCVMTAMTVNYAPNNVPAFFRTGDPVMMDLTLSFKEMSPFISGDVDGKKDSPQDNPNKVSASGMFIDSSTPAAEIQLGPFTVGA